MRYYPSNSRVIPQLYEDEIIAIWKKAGREPFFKNYIFGLDTGKLTKMKNRKYVFSAGRPLPGNAPQLWRLADYLCDLCLKEHGEPEPGYLESLSEFNEQLKQKTTNMRTGYNQTAYKKTKPEEKGASA